jgi:hypothetical protein
MRRLVATAIAAASATALTAAPALAISTYNAEPAPERTEVGAFVALYDRDGDGLLDRFRWMCSGAMVDDDTYLTAAHCTNDWYEGDRFFVSLEQDVQGLLDAYADGHGDPAELTPEQRADYVEQEAQHFLDMGYVVEGDAIGDPRFPGPSNDTHDIGVIDFAGRDTDPSDVWEFEPATLPSAGQLSEIGRRTLDASTWWTVGYGTEEAARGPGGHTHPGGGERMKAEVGFNSLTKAWVNLSMVEARDYGGTCYGDSGGPNYVVLDGEWLLASTTITGDTPCYATNVTYRLDTDAAREFLAQFVDLA